MNNKPLTYFIPDHGQMKTTLSIPESYSLHICPAACGRRNGIRAVKNGSKKRMSFLYMSQADLVSGKYEEMISEAIAELREVIEPSPRLFMLFVNCVDDFLGTDEKAVICSLEKDFPGCRFSISHINPVADDTKLHPGLKMHSQLYKYLEPQQKDEGINFIGNFVSLDPECEIFGLLKGWGTGPVRQIFDCNTFDEYMEMSKSRINIVLQEMGTYAGKQLQERLSTPWIFMPASLRIAEIDENYNRLAVLLNKKPPLILGETLAPADYVKQPENQYMPDLDSFCRKIKESAYLATDNFTSGNDIIYPDDRHILPGDGYCRKTEEISEKNNNSLQNPQFKEPVPDRVIKYRNEALKYIEKARKHLEGKSIIVDSGASMRASNMARALLEYGFCISAVFLLHEKAFDLSDSDWIKKNHPEVRFIERETYEEIISYGLSDESICIGYDCAYLLKAQHCIKMWHDEGYYGYSGIIKLMKELIEL